MQESRLPAFDIREPLSVLRANPELTRRLAEAAIGDQADPDTTVDDHINQVSSYAAMLIEQAEKDDSIARIQRGFREHLHTIAVKEMSFPPQHTAEVVDQIYSALVIRGRLQP